MADTIKAADGGYLFNSKQFEYNGKVLGIVNGALAWVDKA